ncbi:MAG: methyltransferase domain-containing protein [Xanthomonadales bacterium]|nr:methyltransferase domain-containing protein [Xanthomonadales bacterium]
MPDKRNGSDDWDLYWAHGYLTSCANAFPGNYEGRVREVWESFFAGLPPGARLIDIATGNGAIALLAAAYAIAHERQLEIYGIDRARINPQAAWTGDRAVLDAVSFRGRTPAEKTGFPDAHFAAVTGQYALEYTDLPATLAELARIMAPGAQGRFVMHHPESVVIRTAREEFGFGALLFEDTQLFEKAEALLRCIINARSPAELARLAEDPAAQAARAELNEAAATIAGVIETATEPELLSTALGYVGRAISGRGRRKPGETFALLAQGRQEIEANLARLADLLNAVVDDDKMKLIQRLMVSVGLRPEPPEVLSYAHQGQQLLMGWVLDISRQSANN